MRIGIDMLAVQSPGSRRRGIGRFGRELVSALIARAGRREVVLYWNDGLPRDPLPGSDSVEARSTQVERGGLHPTADGIAQTNPHGLDVFLTLNAFELNPGYITPAPPRNGLRLASVLHDLIPFLDQERYLTDPPRARWFYECLRRLRGHDRLLANSEATRQDGLRFLGVDRARIATILGASDPVRFRPDRSFPPEAATRRAFSDLGITRPFVFCVGGADRRKNLDGLIAAFALLPVEIRSAHQLVVGCHLMPEDAARLRSQGDDLGLGDSLVLTGEMDESTLLALYQRCEAFAMPSLYEGLGLPLLEAMLCGVPVLGGRNSSQVEIVGDAGLLVDASDPSAIADGLRRLLTDREMAEGLARKGLQRAAGFTWGKTADAAWSAFEEIAVPARRPRLRPRLAIVSPWPPKKSGVATYAARLAEELASRYRIDLLHEEGYIPDLSVRRGGFPCFDARALPRLAAVRDYRGILYQMGNSPYHGFLYDLMRSHPGIVTLHDFSLAGFQYWRASETRDPAATFAEEVERCEPASSAEILAQISRWRDEPGSIQEAFTRRGISLNRGVLEAAEAVVTHSPSCLNRCRAMGPALAEKVRVILHGAEPASMSAEERRALRERFGIAPDAVVFGSFGFLSRGKMNVEALRAFAEVARDVPGAIYLFAGEDWENGEAQAEAARLGLSDRVRFCGRCPADEFRAFIAITDVGVSLRRPPTYGETSGALLDLLRHGVASIVADVGTFADYTADVVVKVPAGEGLHPALVSAMRSLAIDPARRGALARRASEHVATRHAWSVVTAEYADLIEETAERRARARRGA